MGEPFDRLRIDDERGNNGAALRGRRQTRMIFEPQIAPEEKKARARVRSSYNVSTYDATSSTSCSVSGWG